MGGKTWSREEELFFWRTIVPMSPKAAVQTGRTVDWEQCALVMLKHFTNKARRKYTKLMLFEHYFQNVTTGHKSPRATDLVAEHKRHLDAHGKSVPVSVPTPRIRAQRAVKQLVTAGAHSKPVGNEQIGQLSPAGNVVMRQTAKGTSASPSQRLRASPRPPPMPAYIYSSGNAMGDMTVLPPLRTSPWADHSTTGYMPSSSPLRFLST